MRLKLFRLMLLDRPLDMNLNKLLFVSRVLKVASKIKNKTFKHLYHEEETVTLLKVKKF